MGRVVSINYLKYEINENGSSKEAYVIGFDHRKNFTKVRVPKAIFVDGEVVDVVGMQPRCLDFIKLSRLELPNTITFNGEDLTEFTGYDREHNGVTVHVYEARNSDEIETEGKTPSFIESIIERFKQWFAKGKVKEIRYMTSNGKKIKVKSDAFDSAVVSHTFRRGVGKIVFENDITKIGEKAFEECALKSITIPDSVATIGSMAFYRCSELKEVQIGSGITSIETAAFCECVKIEKLYCNAVTPPKIECTLFTTYDSKNYPSLYRLPDTIFVPKKSVNAYKQANVAFPTSIVEGGYKYKPANETWNGWSEHIKAK